jgi:hypothetical protein
VTAGRAVAHLLLAVLGVLVGAAGALVQTGWFPAGLLLALLAVAGLCYGGVVATGIRAGAVSGAAGWLVSVVLLTTARPEGDFLFGAGLGSYVYLFGGVMTAVMCATLPQAVSSGGRSARLGK